MRRTFPTWIKLLIPAGLFLVVLLVAVIKTLTDEPPAYAGTAAVQTRFAEQIDFLREMAESLPTDGCPGTSLLDTKELLDAMRPWLRQLRIGADLFADPAILDAEVFANCDDSVANFKVKDEADAGFTWSRPSFLNPDELPRTTLWYSGAGRMVRYEDRVPDTTGEGKGFRLLLDLELLGGETVEEP